MTKPRLLIPVTMQFSVRYLLRTGLLARISEYARPVIALGWDDEELRREFEHAGAEVHRLPAVERGAKYERLRALLNLWHQDRLGSSSSAIDERRRQAQSTSGERARRKVRLKLDEWGLRRDGEAERLLHRERWMLHVDTNIWRFATFVTALRVDAALSLTPFLADEEMLLRACATERLPLCAAVLSFDNLTTRGWIPINFDQYLLWNDYNRDELLRGYPHVAPEQISIVGPAQFDFYWNRDYLWEKRDWQRRLRLPDDRPVILYGAGPHHIVPHEPHFVAQLDDAITADEIPGDPVILLRRHPNDPLERWLPLLNRARNIVYDDPWPADGPVLGRTNVRDDDIERLVSSLCHSDVHVSVSSTMTIDGAIFDRPQIGPAYDDRPGGAFDRVCYELYEREHYVPITESGGLDLVRSRDEMIAAVRSALADPERFAEGRKRLVRELCTYTDGQCTRRVDDGLRAFLGQSQPQAVSSLRAVAAMAR